MNGFMFQLATKVLFSNGVLNLAGAEAKKLGAASAVVITDANMMQSSCFGVLMDSLKATCSLRHRVAFFISASSQHLRITKNINEQIEDGGPGV